MQRFKSPKQAQGFLCRYAALGGYYRALE
jgi:hypothetical protein